MEFNPQSSLTPEHVSPDHIYLSSLPRRSDPLFRPVGGHFKRLIDIFIAVTALVALAPLMIGVALIIWLGSNGPILYGHQRVGFGGRTFRCWKFRSMVVDGDVVLERYLRANPDAQREWERDRKLRRDPRVTPIGAVIRMLSIDELPQLFNILAGEMSVVGPRPVVAAELRRYRGSAGHYLRTRPGLTGMWQVSGRSDLSYRQRVLLDRYYVMRWTVMADIAIILRTIPAVLRSRGSC
ncbi:sugar transferase [Rhodobacter sp. CZR27]|uniref:sugar transferase n=1 Tax=Rhodobacter sp. CZR27 TaxID=2033869 RepID=UPI000BBE35F2|nr:sugar transferase [Rhodobacter sp. CZR27]